MRYEFLTNVRIKWNPCIKQNHKIETLGFVVYWEEGEGVVRES